MNDFEKTDEVKTLNPERVKPEECKTAEDFDKAVEKRAAQLDVRIDNSDAAQKWADKIAKTTPVDKLIERRNKLEESESKSQENFKDACFGEHSPDERAKLISKTKEAWESSHMDKHRIDMALKRKGYDPPQDPGETSEPKRPKPPFPVGGPDPVPVRMSEMVTTVETDDDNKTDKTGETQTTNVFDVHSLRHLEVTQAKDAAKKKALLLKDRQNQNS